MLADINQSIKNLLFDLGPLPGEVDMRFEMPTREWIDTLTRPTINMYLFNLRENTELRQGRMQAVTSNGGGLQRMPPRRFDLHYMVSVLTTEVEDEHLLLWGTLKTLLKYTPLPPEVLPCRLWPLLFRNKHEPFPPEVHAQIWPLLFSDISAAVACGPDDLIAGRSVGWANLRETPPRSAELTPRVGTATVRKYVEDYLLPVGTAVGKIDDGPRALDIWGALETPPHPALLLTVTVPLDLDIDITEKLVLTRMTRYTRPDPDLPEPVASPPVRQDLRAPVNPAGMPADGMETRLAQTPRNAQHDHEPTDGLRVDHMHIQIGGVVRDRAGNPVPGVLVFPEDSAVPGRLTDALGRYILLNVPRGRLTVRITRGTDPAQADILTRATLTVPSAAYDITLD
jgi:hypothetical protein